MTTDLVATSPRADRRSRTEALLDDPDTINHLCAEIGCGATLTEWTRQRDISYNVVNAWIEADEKRREQYAMALLKRDSHNKDLITTALRNFTDFDPAACYSEQHNTLLTIHDMPEAVRRCIVSIKTQELFDGVGEERRLIGYTKEIKFTDRNKAAETLARALKMLTDKTEHGATPDLAALIAGASK